MDDIARYNKMRWQQLVEANAVYTQPFRDMTPAEAQARLDPNGELGEIRGKKVLGLASGGGKQSVLYGLLGADITIFDLSDAQLEIDRATAAEYGFEVTLIQGDMRDLSAFADDTFDIVEHPYSINFVLEIGEVFRQIARVIKQGGVYKVMFANPFSAGVRLTDWNGAGYVVSQPYRDGEKVTYTDEDWVYDKDEHSVPPPIEYRHTLSHLINSLAGAGFVIQRFREVGSSYLDADAEGGTWEHLTNVLPPWMWIHAIYRPDVLGK